jgi:hypothetical protein
MVLATAASVNSEIAIIRKSYTNYHTRSVGRTRTPRHSHSDVFKEYPVKTQRRGLKLLYV